MRFAAAAKRSRGTAVTIPARKSMIVGDRVGAPEGAGARRMPRDQEGQGEGRGDEGLGGQPGQGLEARLLLDQAVEAEAPARTREIQGRLPIMIDATATPAAAMPTAQKSSYPSSRVKRARQGPRRPGD